MTRADLGRECVDFAAHASMAFLACSAAWFAGTEWTAPAAVFVSWALGFVRQWTVAECGGDPVLSLASLVNQSGWTAGGVAFTFVASIPWSAP